MGDIAARKLEIIQAISQMQGEGEISQLEAAVRQIRKQNERNKKYRAIIREKTDPEEIKRIRGFKGHDKEEIFRLIREIDIQEPIELLLSQLTK